MSKLKFLGQTLLTLLLLTALCSPMAMAQTYRNVTLLPGLNKIQAATTPSAAGTNVYYSFSVPANTTAVYFDFEQTVSAASWVYNLTFQQGALEYPNVQTTIPLACSSSPASSPPAFTALTASFYGPITIGSQVNQAYICPIAATGLIQITVNSQTLAGGPQVAIYANVINGTSSQGLQAVDAAGGMPIGGSQYTNVTGAGSTALKTSAGTLHNLVINGTGTGTTFTIFDNTSCSGTKIATGTIASGANPFALSYDVQFKTGLCITTTAVTTADYTVSYR